MTRYVICGAAGFIGRNVAERFGKLFPGQVLGTYFEESAPPDIPGVKWTRADLRSPEVVDGLFEAGDVVVYMAAVTSGAKDTFERPYIHVTDNAVMVSLILRACHEKSVARFIYPSCAALYPWGEARGCLEEDDIIAPLNADESPYLGVGWTKVYIEKMCQFYARLGRTRYTVMRVTNVYGPHDKYNLENSHMYSATVTKVMQAPEGGGITVWGPGTESRDLLYIDDQVDFIVSALGQKTPFEIVNVGGGRAWTINEVVETVIKASGKNLKVEHDLTKPHIPSNIWTDNGKAARLFGWRPKTDLMMGTGKTLEWYRRNIGAENQ